MNDDSDVVSDQVISTVDYDQYNLTELAAMLKKIKGELDAATETKTSFQKEYDLLSMTIIPDRMDEDGVSSMNITGVGRLQVMSDIRCSVPAKHKEAVQLWLVENGHASMISETINSSTLKAFIKEQMKEGNEWPEKLLSVQPYSRATVVKGG